MVFTTDHVSDFHIPVVHYYAEIIGWRSVSTTNDKVIQLLVAKFDRAADLVIKDNRAILWVSKTHYARLIRSMLAVVMAATTVITRFFAFCHLLFAQRIQTLPGAVALIGRACHQHLVNYGVIAVKTFGLEVWAFVPRQIQPVHPIHNGFNCFRR